MTTTYDPNDPAYYSEADLRGELTRVYDLCHGCRLCFNLCPSFPTMFDAIDRHDGAVHKLTEAEQDQVVDECYQCKLCYVKCPYTPPHEWELDFPRLMARAEAVKHKQRRVPKLADHALARTDLTGAAGSAVAPLANAAIAKPGGLIRKAMEKTVGIAAERLLPPFAKQRFSTWFRSRRAAAPAQPQAAAALFPTCLVEYQNPAIGQDLVKVLEHNDVTCSLPPGQRCCGMPWLDAGDVDRFVEAGRANLAVLAPAVRGGADVVVPQPTCGYVLKKEYPQYIGGDDAALVAAHTYDAGEYLWKLHKGEGTSLRTEFPGDHPASVAYHAACHLQAQQVGFRFRDLLKLIGTKVEVVARCSGIDGLWGYRAEHYELSRQVAKPMAAAINASSADAVIGDCHLANGAILQETGKAPRHPIEVVARAYGLAPEPGA